MNLLDSETGLNPLMLTATQLFQQIDQELSQVDCPIMSFIKSQELSIYWELSQFIDGVDKVNVLNLPIHRVDDVFCLCIKAAYSHGVKVANYIEIDNDYIQNSTSLYFPLNNEQMALLMLTLS